MGNDGFLTAKAISKRIKAKGLGRLRWYCQMCEKQCRDENGFKCHTKSAGHQRQLTIFAENPTEYVSRFSDQFRKEFLLVLRQRYGANFVQANTVYQECIKDRDHVHMNSTRWTTLTAFVKELGKEGYCRVEDREDGWWLSFLPRDNYDKDRRAKEMNLRTLEDEERSAILLQNQIERAKSLAQTSPEAHEDHQYAEDSKPLSMSLGKKSKRRRVSKLPENGLVLHSISQSKTGAFLRKKKKRSNRWQNLGNVPLPQTMSSAETAPASLSNESAGDKIDASYTDSSGNESETIADVSWLRPNIMVKVTNNELVEGSFFGKKGKILDVLDGFGARVSLIDSDIILELDQDDLETVIPKPGGVVYLLRGPHRGKKAAVRSIDIDKFSVRIELLETGEELSGIEYEAVSRAT